MLTDWMTEWEMLIVRACFMLARVRTPSSPVREREIKRELLFLFLKGMMGALAPFIINKSIKK
jgi:hypothetical protein